MSNIERHSTTGTNLTRTGGTLDYITWDETDPATWDDSYPKDWLWNYDRIEFSITSSNITRNTSSGTNLTRN